MKHVTSLAGQTAIYGVSSILGRVLNYLLIPLHTAIFLPDVLGIRDYFYVVIALLLIVFTHGMETTYFRFSSKPEISESDSFNQTFTSVLIVSLVGAFLIWFNAEPLARLAEYPDYGQVIRWTAVIVFIDSVTAIPFARLRLQNQARVFASLKILSIVLNIVFQLIFLVYLPSIYEPSAVDGVTSNFFAEPRIDHIFLANMVANIIILLMFAKTLLSYRPAFSIAAFRPYLLYSLPLLLTGISGWVVDQADKFLVKEMMTTEDLGVYAQTFKLAIFMSLAVQAFRYAGEPFFFNKHKEENAPSMFADILYYFTLFSLVVFVGVGVNVELIGNIFLRNPAYRVALNLVPILLMAKLFFGVYVNISIWFKLKDKTIYGTYFTLVGALITIAGNLLLIPSYGYLGTAITMLLGYVVMTTLCYLVGRKYFPVPYEIPRLTLHIIFASMFTFLALQISFKSALNNYIVHLFLSLLYLLILYLFEGKRWRIKSA